MKHEIEIPEGWEFEDRFPPCTDVVGPERARIIIPLRRKDTREDWQKRIDELIEHELSQVPAPDDGLFIPPSWTAHEYKGWKYYTKSSLPDWVVSTPHREGWDWLHQDYEGGCFESYRKPGMDSLSDLTWHVSGFLKLTQYMGLPLQPNFRNERYHWENGQWVHRPWGSMPGESD